MGPQVNMSKNTVHRQTDRQTKGRDKLIEVQAITPPQVKFTAKGYETYDARSKKRHRHYL